MLFCGPWPNRFNQRFKAAKSVISNSCTRRQLTKNKYWHPDHWKRCDHGQGEPSFNLWDMVFNLTPDLRQRQLHDEAMTCGTQPANIRVINRRFNDPASFNALDDSLYVLPVKLKLQRKANRFFWLTCVNHIRLRLRKRRKAQSARLKTPKYKHQITNKFQ